MAIGAGAAATTQAATHVGAVGTNHTATGPCRGATPTVRYTHIIWILEENHSYGDIIGSPKAPYINSVANECALATNYHNITHPSLPNYVGMTSGLPLKGLSQFVSDCNPSSTCSTGAASIFGQTPTWKAYEESMPSNCYLSDFGPYAVRHNPVPYFSKLAKSCKANDVPYTHLASDLSSGKLPTFSFITPNLINDMHDGSVQQGDAWLKTNLPKILNSSAYQSGHTVVFIVWDEGAGGTSNHCATNTTDVGCHVPLITISPTTAPGTRVGSLLNHYSLLHGTESLLGLPWLGASAGAGGLGSAFGL